MRAVDINGNFHEVSKDEVSWRVHVYGVIINEGKILLSPQHGENRYDLPGGKVDIDESIEEGLCREVKEETGVDVRIIKQLATRDILFKVTFREPQEVWHSVMIYYLCQMTGGSIAEMKLDEHESSYAREAVWLDLGELDSISPAASYDWREVVKAHLSAN